MKNNNRFKTEIEDAIAVGDQVQLHGIVNADNRLTLREIGKSDDLADDNGNSNASNDNSNAGNSNDDSDDNSNEHDGGSNSGPGGG